MKVLGIVLIVVGVLALAYGGITWSHRDKVVDLGPVEVTRQEHERIPLPPVVGAVAVAAGIAALLASGRHRAA